MMMMFKSPSATFLALGVGIILGAGGSILFFRSANDRQVFGVLENLLIKVDELRDQIAELKEVNAAKRTYYSPQGSSGDEEYVDAQGGNNLDLKSPKVGESPSASREHVGDYSDIIGRKGDDAFFVKVDLLMEGSKEDQKKAFTLLHESQEKYKTNSEFTWRLSKSTFQMADTHKSQSKEKKELLLQARDYANASIVLDVDSANAHKWYAIIVGSLTEYLGIHEQIELAYSIKHHIEVGLKLNPKDAFLHYMLGRWHYRVYMMTWMERKLADMLFNNRPPATTPEETLDHFMTAERLRPRHWKMNLLHIARCHIEMQHYPEAVKWLLQAKKLKRSEIDDEKTDEDINQLLSKYLSYG